MALPLDTLIRAVTKDEAFEMALDMLESVKIPARSWRRGGVARSIVGVLATVAAQASDIVANGIASQFLEHAQRDWLTLLAHYLYKVERITATFASGYVTLTNQGGGVFDYGANEVVIKASSTGARYRITEAFHLGVLGEVTVAVAAIEAGSASSAEPGAIDTLETTMQRVVVGNVEAVIGLDAESDDDLKTRCWASIGTLSPNGPRDAFEFAVRSATIAGNPTNINRLVVKPALGNGTVRLVCASASGTPTSEELTAARASVELLARTDTDTVLLEGAASVVVSKTITIWRRGSDDDTVRAAAFAALETLSATYPIGGIAKFSGGQGYLYTDAISSAVIGAGGGAVFDVDYDVPTDTPLADNEVPTIAANILVRTAA